MIFYFEIQSIFDIIQEIEENFESDLSSGFDGSVFGDDRFTLHSISEQLELLLLLLRLLLRLLPHDFFFPQDLDRDLLLRRLLPSQAPDDLRRRLLLSITGPTERIGSSVVVASGVSSWASVSGRTSFLSMTWVQNLFNDFK